MVNIEQVRREWDRRGFSCDVWVDPPGQRWEDYVHTTDERVMVVEAQVEFEIAGVCHRPPPGETLLIPAGALHSVRNLGAGQARWLYGYRRRVTQSLAGGLRTSGAPWTRRGRHRPG